METKNTYKKYCPNVFVAKCPEKHKKGEEIILTTRRGKENEHIVHNLVHKDEKFYYYSITRKDGYNAQEKAKKKAERRKDWAASAERKADEAWEKSQQHKDFLSLGEPIKVGHHSEGRHRKLLENNHKNIGKMVELKDKAKDHERKAEYWERKAKDINLSMPESLEYFKKEHEEYKEHHRAMKAGEIERPHGYALTYARKKVKEMKDKYETAQKLWG